MNKTIAVLQHMREHEGITQLEATELYGATRLSSIVFNLRKRGHDIETVTMGTTDRYGHAINYAKYVLRESKQDADA